MVQLTLVWSGPTAVYIQAEGMGKTQMNIFWSQLLSMILQTCIFLRLVISFSYDIWRHVWRDQAYDNLSGKKGW